MNDTKLFVKVKGELTTVPFSDLQGEYELFHSSQIRKCYINGVNQKIIQSGDLVLFKNSQVFLKGRIDRLVKINANLVDLDLIESTLRSKWTNLIFSVFLLKENYLVVSIFYESKLNEKDLKSKIGIFLSEKFPFYYEPRKIMVLDKLCLPFTIHGKLDYAKLKAMAIEEENNKKIPLENINVLTLVKNLWKEKLGSEPESKTNFIKAGGNSLKALIFAEEIKEHLEKSSIFLNNNLLLDTLLNQTFEQILKLIERPNSNQEINLMEPKSSKKIKLDSDDVDSRFYLNSNIVCCLSKSFSFLKSNLGTVSKNKSVLVSPVWKMDTTKCVDATPLIVGNVCENGLKNRVYIGSHSGKFICVDALNGVLKWDFEALDRIESSSCLDKTGSFVLF
ncbi:acyl- synthetase family member 4 isoform X1, partial [Brachionus plicatilis]